MDIHQRYEALPRARKGTTTVVIVEEDMLAKLIDDAAAYGREQVTRQPAPAVQICVDPPPASVAAAIATEAAIDRRRRIGRGRSR